MRTKRVLSSNESSPNEKRSSQSQDVKMRCLSAKYCLCCISLKPAGIVLGVLSIVLTICEIIRIEYNYRNKISSSLGSPWVVGFHCLFGKKISSLTLIKSLYCVHFHFKKKFYWYKLFNKNYFLSWKMHKKQTEVSSP